MTVPGRTLVSILREAANRVGDAKGLRYHDSVESSLYRGYAQMDRNARTIADALTAAGFDVGDVALIGFPQGLAWADAVFGVLYAGMTFVPTGVLGPVVSAEIVATLRRTYAAADADALITDRATAEALAPCAGEGVRIIVVEDLLESGDPDEWVAPAIDADSLALLTFTSGSTGDPKGVLLNHGALVTMTGMVIEVEDIDDDSVAVGWLPLHHVFGVATQLLMPVAAGIDTVVTPTAMFQRRPVSWLQLLSAYRATTTAAGNFAFDLCTRLVTDDQLSRLDLSNIKTFGFGSEPIRIETVRAFVQRFASVGATESMVMPGYGMSEVAFVCGKSAREDLVVKQFDPNMLAEGRLVGSNGSGVIEMVSCGRAAPGVTLAVVDPDTLRRLPDGEVGELFLSAPTVASGYYKKPEITAETFGLKLADDDRDYLRTGDLAALVDGEVFITGRRKEVIIIRGRNIYPLDLENTAQELMPSVGLAAAFELHGHPSAVGIVVEYDPESLERPDEQLEGMARVLRDGLASAHSLPSLAVALVPVGALPRTPTGKIQRGPTRTALERGELVPDYSHGFATRATVEA